LEQHAPTHSGLPASGISCFWRLGANFQEEIKYSSTQKRTKRPASLCVKDAFNAFLLFFINNKKKNGNSNKSTGNIKIYKNLIYIIHILNLSLFFIIHNQKQDNDDDQRAKDVEAGHNISCSIHKKLSPNY